jgi:hypothetical protein
MQAIGVIFRSFPAVFRPCHVERKPPVSRAVIFHITPRLRFCRMEGLHWTPAAMISFNRPQENLDKMLLTYRN